MNYDAINGSFELVGSIFIWMNVYRMYVDKEIKGVYFPTMVFFFSWGVWNLFYYPHLGQMYSFYAGILLAAGNFVWVCQVVYYHFHKPKRKLKAEFTTQTKEELREVYGMNK